MTKQREPTPMKKPEPAPPEQPAAPEGNNGPFIYLGHEVWVNAFHISAIAGTQDPNKCWVTTLSTGNSEDVSYPVDTAPQVVIDGAVSAMMEWSMIKGEQHERGRLEVNLEIE